MEIESKSTNTSPSDVTSQKNNGIPILLFTKDAGQDTLTLSSPQAGKTQKKGLSTGAAMVFAVIGGTATVVGAIILGKKFKIGEELAKIFSGSAEKGAENAVAHIPVSKPSPATIEEIIEEAPIESVVSPVPIRPPSAGSVSQLEAVHAPIEPALPIEPARVTLPTAEEVAAKKKAYESAKSKLNAFEKGSREEYTAALELANQRAYYYTAVAATDEHATAVAEAAKNHATVLKASGRGTSDELAANADVLYKEGDYYAALNDNKHAKHLKRTARHLAALAAEKAAAEAA